MFRIFNSQTRSPLSWYGGKAVLCRVILPLFPPHKRYCEVFGGSLSLFFAKPPAQEEIVNDLDPGVANLWRVVKDPDLGEQLYRALRYTLNSRQDFSDCKLRHPDPPAHARSNQPRGLAITSAYQKTGWRTQNGGTVYRIIVVWAENSKSKSIQPALFSVPNVKNSGKKEHFPVQAGIDLVPLYRG